MRSVSAIFLFDCRPGCSNGAGAGKNVPDHSPDSENRHRIYVIILQCLQTESRWNMNAASMSGDRFRVKNAAEIISPNRRRSNALNKQPSTLHFSQYGGGFLARCAFAASIHQLRSSANLGNARSSALPPSPIGSPCSDSDCAIGPAAIVDEITTMPISESVPCHAVAARTPEKRPAE